MFCSKDNHSCLALSDPSCRTLKLHLHFSNGFQTARRAGPCRCRNRPIPSGAVRRRVMLPRKRRGPMSRLCVTRLPIVVRRHHGHAHAPVGSVAVRLHLHLSRAARARSRTAPDASHMAWAQAAARLGPHEPPLPRPGCVWLARFAAAQGRVAQRRAAQPAAGGAPQSLSSTPASQPSSE